MRLDTLAKLLRIDQWVKNLFVLIPLIFNRSLFDSKLLLYSIIAFFSFCFISSAVYIFNDLCDIRSDRNHPLKRKRPIASGRIKPFAAAGISFLLILLCYATIIATDIPTAVILIISVYLVMNILYSVTLKNIAILDVMIIAIGFVLRVLAGGAATGIEVTPWLVMMVFILTLLIAFGKRRDDLVRKEEYGESGRRSVAHYNVMFINQVIAILGAVVIVAYISYTLTPEVEIRFHSKNVYITSIFVIGAVLRYLQLALVKENTGDPTRIFYTDRFIQLCMAGWLILFLLIIYL